jgi:hypothetical protein
MVMIISIKGGAIEIARMLRQVLEALPKDAAKLEAQQDLGPEDEPSDLVESGFDEPW